MDELIKTIQEKTGVDADKAQEIVKTVAGFLKDKLPAPIAGQVEKFLTGGGDDGGEGGGIGGLMDKAKDGLGGLLGG